MKNVSNEDIDYVQTFVRTEFMTRLMEKFQRLGIPMTETDKTQFFGRFVSDISRFEFSCEERSLILDIAAHVKSSKFNHLSPATDERLAQRLKMGRNWFCDEQHSSLTKKDEIKAPIGARNLLSKMLEAAQKNSQRPKQGYRYDNEIKNLAVYNRILAGPMGYKSLQLNLEGCFPSISTTNRFIHRSDHSVIEGELRCEELAAYLRERNLKSIVCTSIDATRIQNRIQYSSHTNELVGFVLPINESNGMPVPHVYKARTADEIIHHFSHEYAIANYVNTVMAQPLGNAAPFCLCVYGTDNRYTAEDVSKLWKHISQKLNEIGIIDLIKSSDSDPKYNSAMRINSGHG